MNVGEKIEPEYKKWFQIVYDAREDARQFIQARLDEGETVRGYEVDRRLKERFEQLGCAQYLMHRTGHNIGHRCHGSAQIWMIMRHMMIAVCFRGRCFP